MRYGRGSRIFFQAEDGIRDIGVTGVQTCALPILAVDPVADKEIIDTELQLKGLETIDSQLTKQQKAAAAGNKNAKLILSELEAYKQMLEQGRNAREVSFESKNDQQAAPDLFLLTSKPVLYV